MKQHVVESGIPLPPKSRTSRFPLADMDVNDSFFSTETPSCLWGAIRHYTKNYAPDNKYSVRQRTEKGITGSRVWRVK